MRTIAPLTGACASLLTTPVRIVFSCEKATPGIRPTASTTASSDCRAIAPPDAGGLKCRGVPQGCHPAAGTLSGQGGYSPQIVALLVREWCPQYTMHHRPTQGIPVHHPRRLRRPPTPGGDRGR